MQAISGKTSFNGDWAENSHLVIEDEFSENNRSVRERIKESIKTIAVTRSQRIHAKSKEALEVTPFWRMSISCNPVEASLSVIPHLDNSVINKISLLETKKFDMPMPARSENQKAQLWLQLEIEAPGLIHELLQYGEPPNHLRDTEDRFGIKAYHSPAVLKMIEDISPELELLNIILDAMASGEFVTELDAISGSMQPDPHLEIIVSALDVYKALGRKGLPHYYNSRTIGRKLTDLANIRPKQVQVVRKSDSQGNLYRIVGNGGELL